MSEIQDLLLAALIALLVTAYTIPVIIRAAKWRKLYDHPNERKVHTVPIPSLGGMGIFIGFMLGLLFMAAYYRCCQDFSILYCCLPCNIHFWY